MCFCYRRHTGVLCTRSFSGCNFPWATCPIESIRSQKEGSYSAAKDVEDVGVVDTSRVLNTAFVPSFLLQPSWVSFGSKLILFRPFATLKVRGISQTYVHLPITERLEKGPARILGSFIRRLSSEVRASKPSYEKSSIAQAD